MGVGEGEVSSRGDREGEEGRRGGAPTVLVRLPRSGRGRSKEEKLW